MLTLWRKEPVLTVVIVVLAVAFVVQRIFFDKQPITADWVQGVIAILGAVVARSQVSSKHTTEDWLPEEYREG